MIDNEKGIAEEESQKSFASEAIQFIGSVDKRLPQNLSVNKKYLKDLGRD